MQDELFTDRVVGPLFAAAVSALVAVVLWLANRISERLADGQRRRQKVADIQRALRAEIRAHSDQLTDADLDDHLVAMRERIRSGGDGVRKFVPVVPRETRDTVYRTYLGELHLLPESVVEPVVIYYAQVVAIADFGADMREERFAGIGADRMEAMYVHFVEMKKTALSQAADAYEALDRALAAPPDDALSVARQRTRAALDRGYRLLGLRHERSPSP